MGKSQHDKISENLAKKHHTDYNKGKGPDVKASERTIEVATHLSDLYSSVDQLRRYKRPYIATPTALVKDALRITAGTGIGVMNQRGKVIKKPRRKK